MKKNPDYKQKQIKQTKTFKKPVPLFKHSSDSNIYINIPSKKYFTEKFIKLLMIHGKKTIASALLYKAGYLMQKKILINRKIESQLSGLIENSRVKKKKGPPRTFQMNLKFSVTKSFLICLDSIKIHVGTLETLLQNSIENVKPSIESRKVRIAGTTYQVPAIISKRRQETISIRWIIQSARKRKRSTPYSFSECLAQELLDAYKKQGGARQKRDELHKIAESNRAYIRYRWW